MPLLKTFLKKSKDAAKDVVLQFSQSKESRLIRAAADGDLDTAEQLLKGPVNVNCVPKGGYSALHYAVAMNNQGMVDKLLAYGADPNSRSNKPSMEGWTPLHLAALHAHVEIARRLIKAGANKDLQTNEGETVAQILQSSTSSYAPHTHQQFMTSLSADGITIAPSVKAAYALPASNQAPAWMSLLDDAKQVTDSKGDKGQQQSEHPPSADDHEPHSGGAIQIFDTIVTQNIHKLGLAQSHPQAARIITRAAEGIVHVNPVILIKVTVMLVRHVRECSAAAAFVRHRSERLKARCWAIMPSIEVLQDILNKPNSGLKKREARSIVSTLALLGRVMLDIKNLIAQIDDTISERVPRIKRTKHLLTSAKVYQETLQAQEAELRDCFDELSFVLNITQLAQNSRAAQALGELRHLQSPQCTEQDEAARSLDLAEFRREMLGMFGSVENMQKELHKELQKELQEGRQHDLQQIAAWLGELGAEHSRFAAHVSQQLSGIDAKIDKLLHHGKGSGVPSHPKADLNVIPRPCILLPQDAVQRRLDGLNGTVQKASLTDGEPVAIKLYNHLGLLPGAEDAWQTREAAMLSLANGHKNLVRCYGTVRDTSSGAEASIHGSLVMEWVGGGTLDSWLEAHPESSLAVRLQLALQVASGVAYLHQKDIVHCALMPSNVLMAEMTASQTIPTVKLCNFGLAELAARSVEAPQQITSYTSPERLKGNTCSQQDDVFAFGILMYFIAEARAPFSESDEKKVAAAIKSGKRPAIDDWQKRLPTSSNELKQVAREYCKLAKQCWAARASQRPSFDRVHQALTDMARRLQASSCQPVQTPRGAAELRSFAIAI